MNVETVGKLEFSVSYETKDDILLAAKIPGTGRITVLDRLTGWCNGIRDIETGFKDITGKFWLASGNFDIRKHPDLTIIEAIEKIKEHANICIGV